MLSTSHSASAIGDEIERAVCVRSCWAPIRNTFLVPVPYKTADTLMAVLRFWIEFGTIVISYCRPGYRDIEKQGNAYTKSWITGSVSLMCVLAIVRTQSRAPGGMWRHCLIPSTESGQHPSPGPLHEYGGPPIRESGAVEIVHGPRCKDGLKRDTYPRLQYYRQVNHRRPTTGVKSPPATCNLCDITYYAVANPLRDIQIALSYVNLRSVRLGYYKFRFVMFRYVWLG
jgi:hypothetical protein